MEIEDKESKAPLNVKVHMQVLEIPWCFKPWEEITAYLKRHWLSPFWEVRDLLRTAESKSPLSHKHVLICMCLPTPPTPQSHPTHPHQIFS